MSKASTARLSYRAAVAGCSQVLAGMFFCSSRPFGGGGIVIPRAKNSLRASGVAAMSTAFITMTTYQETS